MKKKAPKKSTHYRSPGDIGIRFFDTDTAITDGVYIYRINKRNYENKKDGLQYMYKCNGGGRGIQCPMTVYYRRRDGWFKYAKNEAGHCQKCVNNHLQNVEHVDIEKRRDWEKKKKRTFLGPGKNQNSTPEIPGQIHIIPPVLHPPQKINMEFNYQRRRIDVIPPHPVPPPYIPVHPTQLANPQIRKKPVPIHMNTFELPQQRAMQGPGQKQGEGMSSMEEPGHLDGFGGTTFYPDSPTLSMDPNSFPLSEPGSFEFPSLGNSESGQEGISDTMKHSKDILSPVELPSYTDQRGEELQNNIFTQQQIQRRMQRQRQVGKNLEVQIPPNKRQKRVEKRKRSMEANVNMENERNPWMMIQQFRQGFKYMQVKSVSPDRGPSCGNQFVVLEIPTHGMQVEYVLTPLNASLMKDCSVLFGSAAASWFGIQGCQDSLVVTTKTPRHPAQVVDVRFYLNKDFIVKKNSYLFEDSLSQTKEREQAIDSDSLGMNDPFGGPISGLTPTSPPSFPSQGDGFYGGEQFNSNYDFQLSGFFNSLTGDTKSKGETLEYENIEDKLLCSAIKKFGMTRNLCGFNLLFYAAAKGETFLVGKILEVLGDEIMSSRDNFGNTALHWAAMYGKKDTCDLLLSKGIDSSVRNWRAMVAEDVQELFTNNEAGKEVSLNYLADLCNEIEEVENVEVLTTVKKAPALRLRLKLIDIDQSGDEVPFQLHVLMHFDPSNLEGPPTNVTFEEEVPFHANIDPFTGEWTSKFLDPECWRVWGENVRSLVEYMIFQWWNPEIVDISRIIDEIKVDKSSFSFRNLYIQNRELYRRMQRFFVNEPEDYEYVRQELLKTHEFFQTNDPEKQEECVTQMIYLEEFVDDALKDLTFAEPRSFPFIRKKYEQMFFKKQRGDEKSFAQPDWKNSFCHKGMVYEFSDTFHSTYRVGNSPKNSEQGRLKTGDLDGLGAQGSMSASRQKGEGISLVPMVMRRDVPRSQEVFGSIIFGRVFAEFSIEMYNHRMYSADLKQALTSVFGLQNNAKDLDFTELLKLYEDYSVEFADPIFDNHFKEILFQSVYLKNSVFDHRSIVLEGIDIISTDYFTRKYASIISCLHFHKTIQFDNAGNFLKFFEKNKYRVKRLQRQISPIIEFIKKTTKDDPKRILFQKILKIDCMRKFFRRINNMLRKKLKVIERSIQRMKDFRETQFPTLELYLNEVRSSVEGTGKMDEEEMIVKKTPSDTPLIAGRVEFSQMEEVSTKCFQFIQKMKSYPFIQNTYHKTVLEGRKVVEMHSHHL